MNTVYTELSFDQIKQLISLATEPGFIGLMAALSSLLAVLLGFVAIYKAAHIMHEKVIENEVGLLFEAFNCFFEYTDAIGLYFSMTKKEIDLIANNKRPGQELIEDVRNASRSVYSKQRDALKTSFLLRMLGQGEAAHKVDTYKNRANDLRKMLKRLLNEYYENNEMNKLLEHREYFESESNALKIERDKCLDILVGCKDKLKASKKKYL